MTMRYRRKDSYYAWKNDGDWANFSKWVEAVNGGVPIAWGEDGYPEVTRNLQGSIMVHTSRGVMTADVGDYLFKTIQGELFALEEDAFEELFEQVPSGTNEWPDLVAHDQETMTTVKRILEDLGGHNHWSADVIIEALLKEGILFREAKDVVEARRQLGLVETSSEEIKQQL